MTDNFYDFLFGFLHAKGSSLKELKGYILKEINLCDDYPGLDNYA